MADPAPIPDDILPEALLNGLGLESVSPDETSAAIRLTDRLRRAVAAWLKVSSAAGPTALRRACEVVTAAADALDLRWPLLIGRLVIERTADGLLSYRIGTRID